MASAIKDLYKGLCPLRKRHQLKLSDAQQKLRSLLEHTRTGSCGDGAQPQHTVPAEAAPGATAMVAKPSALSLQVRGMRRAHDVDDSVQRNVSEAFDGVMRRLNALYDYGQDADAPKEFDQRLRYWHLSRGLPHEAHQRLQRLRVWRNAALHHDEHKWMSEGPRSTSEASEHLGMLEVSMRALEEAKRGARL